MTEVNQVLKCDLCGNIVEVLHTGASVIICCGQEMKILEPNTIDAAQEKHVPVIEKTDNGYKVTVGSVVHPMEESHYIEWIELLADGKTYRQNLKPEQDPVAEFCVDAAKVEVREHCNLHGLWKAEN